MARPNRGRTRKVSSSESTSENPPKRAAPPFVKTMKPLSYEGLKVVLQYMDPNKRFQIARAITSIQRTNKIVPLKLDTLTFGEMSMTVNGTKYQFGIIREFYEGHEKQDGIEHENEKGGTFYDLDPYGFRDDSADAVLTPGDVRFQDPKEPTQWTPEEMQNRLNRCEQRCRYRARQKTTSHPYELYTEIYLLENRLKGKLPPFTRVIQLTITEPGGNTTIQRAPYTFRLHEVFKNLTTNFLGSRQLVQVKKLDFDIEGGQTAIRLPVGLQFQVETLSLKEDVQNRLNVLTPLIHETSFPLSCLEIGKFEDHQLHHPIIKNGLKKLVFNGNHHELSLTALNLHENIHVTGRWFVNANLIRNWMETLRAVGTCVTSAHKFQWDALKQFEYIENEDFRFVRQEKEALSIFVNNSSEIQLKIEYVNPEVNGMRWLIRMEMVATNAK